MSAGRSNDRKGCRFWRRSAQMPSRRRTRGASAGATVLAPSIRRVILVDFFSRLCRLPEPAWVSLPLPVTLIRFLVPECVLFLGIASLTFHCRGDQHAWITCVFTAVSVLLAQAPSPDRRPCMP